MVTRWPRRKCQTGIQGEGAQHHALDVLHCIDDINIVVLLGRPVGALAMCSWSRGFTVVLGVLLIPALQAAAKQSECVAKINAWIAEQNRLYPLDRQADPHKMLYFLHVPRTAGRTTHNCFLMPITPPSRRCAKSYDGLKYDISLPDCGVIASHDDFSAMASFPSTAAVFTTIRDPVSRFLSAYEFAVELGGRDAVRFKPGREPDKKQGRTSTKEVWPWSYLQPLLAEDMKPRVRYCNYETRSIPLCPQIHNTGSNLAQQLQDKAACTSTELACLSSLGCKHWWRC
jgi:hypothetical protein